MMKGIKFDNIHSFEDLNLILSQVDIPPATPKEVYVDIPSGDGSVDLTEALGEVKYNNREATITFTALPQDDFEQKKKQVSNLLNGVRFKKIVLDKDPNYYWVGRCKINEYASDKNLHKIVVGAVLAPYKLKKDETVVTIPAGENTPVVLSNSRKTVVPVITCAEETTVILMGNTYKLNSGTHTVPDLVLKFGENPMTITSEGAVKFTYQEGDL
jgi:predicted phage tail component-like protein